MNIIYITNSLEKDDFEAFSQGASTKPNPAGQNFHRRLIETLSIKNQVEIISVLPVESTSVLEDKDHYHYCRRKKGKFSSFFSKPKEIAKKGAELFPNDSPIIIYDALNISIARGAALLAKKRNLLKVPVLTDNPNNLANHNYFYKLIVFRYAANADGSIALTKPLVMAYDLLDKPHTEIEGIASLETKNIKPCLCSYIYFAGALYERYGVKDLLRAYIKAKPNYDLYVAGHGPLAKDFIEASKSNERIHFLGQISAAQNASMENGAALLVNPRRNDQKLDLESIPSKMLEYLTTESPILSTPNPFLQDDYPNDVNWLPNSGERAIETFLLDHLDANGNLINLVKNNARQKVIAEYGETAISEKLQSFLASLKTNSN